MTEALKYDICVMVGGAFPGVPYDKCNRMALGRMDLAAGLRVIEFLDDMWDEFQGYLEPEPDDEKACPPMVLEVLKSWEGCDVVAAKDGVIAFYADEKDWKPL